ncbi:flavodoxin [Candidatus Atribacteria bacterium RBG_19FT_COMBO_35_14]|uniref:Flavodoxin n=1 Tax=Candidatus Sediminicultor quintus TaxID=1797291 RepID=A0A1F5A7G4_9BACT|nr:MAG: flavodoxin [Candidatus Atribacteria bacterium RBG_19FT_COMBO_35_14]
MKTVVIYKSISGFTKKYAEWIAEELEADLLKLKKIDIDILLKYDIIIYGGSLHAVGISGVNIIKNNLHKLKDKNIIVFTTGASPSKESIVSELKNKNFSAEEQKRIQFYYFRGGFDFVKLNLINKILMTLLKWKIKLNRDRTSDEKGMLAAYSKPRDFTKKENIKELLEYVRSLR